jgi:hypothetical protein
VCRAGEAGLRIGEVRALPWREDVDMVAKSITINEQLSSGREELEGGNAAVKQYVITPTGTRSARTRHASA